MKFKPFTLILWIIIIFWGYFYSTYSNFENRIIIEKEQNIKIKKGETLNWLGKKLWLTSLTDKYIYKFYLKFNAPKNFKLQAWEYVVRTDSNIKKVFEALTKPVTNDKQITLLEWWNIYDIDNYLSNKDLIKKWEFILKTENFDKKLIEKYPFLEKAKTLEWFLYPDSYDINPDNFSINILISKMLKTFEKKAYKKYLSSYSSKEIVDLINLASIVEKEEKNSEAKPIVANILKKRWKENWKIWADITVCYPHKLTSQQCKMVVSKYIREKSDYNTRTKIWLPKTPIGNPSADTINATVNDEKTPHYFYLHDSDWNIYYATTNAEHELNKSKFMK